MANPLIRDVRVILTEPDGIRLVIVKVETTEPELYGVGCATFTQRPTAVLAAVDDYLRPFVIGKDPGDIEDIWQSSYVSSYWRNGPVLNNALSGIDQALWDIKGKLAGMPVYDLWGGKARDAAAVYVHADGSEPSEVEDRVRAFTEAGHHHVRVQMATPGFQSYGARGGDSDTTRQGPRVATDRTRRRPGSGALEAHPAGIFEPTPYTRTALALFEHLRSTVGWDVELLHDVHERIPPIQGVGFAKDVERFKLFFLEDLFPPEDNDYFRIVRQQTSTPLAMGELYNNPHEIITHDQGPAHRLHTGAHLADRRAHPGQEAGGPVRGLQRPHGVARPRRHVAGRACRQPDARPQRVELRHTRVRHVSRAHQGGFPRMSRRYATGTCGPTAGRALASTWTRPWQRSSRSGSAPTEAPGTPSAAPTAPWSVRSSTLMRNLVLTLNP